MKSRSCKTRLVSICPAIRLTSQLKMIMQISRRLKQLFNIPNQLSDGILDIGSGEDSTLEFTGAVSDGAGSGLSYRYSSRE